MPARFWTGLSLAGCLLAVLALLWPVISLIARGQWLTGAAVATVVGLILGAIWIQSRQR